MLKGRGKGIRNEGRGYFENIGDPVCFDDGWKFCGDSFDFDFNEALRSPIQSNPNEKLRITNYEWKTLIDWEDEKRC